jgi:hypothetical protein
MSLPQHLINMIYEYNPSHRPTMLDTLVQIQSKCVCKQCARQIALEFCLKPSSQIFCGNGCANAWLEERTEEPDWEQDTEEEIDLLAFGDEYDQFMYEEFVKEQDEQNYEYDSESE